MSILNIENFNQTVTLDWDNQFNSSTESFIAEPYETVEVVAYNESRRPTIGANDLDFNVSEAILTGTNIGSFSNTIQSMLPVDPPSKGNRSIEVNVTAELCENMTTLIYSPNLTFFNITTMSITQDNLLPDNSSYCGWTHNLSCNGTSSFTFQADINVTNPNQSVEINREINLTTVFQNITGAVSCDVGKVINASLFLIQANESTIDQDFFINFSGV